MNGQKVTILSPIISGEQPISKSYATSFSNTIMESTFNVAVVIPVYNAADYIAKAVESALLQPEVSEVVLVEDRSPDNSLQICQELVGQNAKVKLFRHPNGENRGAAASRNLGVRMSSAPYIAFLDAD